MPSVIAGLALLAFWLYCLFDVITTPPRLVRTLTKPLWVLIVGFLAAIGGLLWLAFGRPRLQTAVSDFTRAASHDRRWPPAGPTPLGPDDDPEFIRQLERRLRDED